MPKLLLCSVSKSAFNSHYYERKILEEAANSIGISRVALSLKLTGKTKNKTNLNYL